MNKKLVSGLDILPKTLEMPGYYQKCCQLPENSCSPAMKWYYGKLLGIFLFSLIFLLSILTGLNVVSEAEAKSKAPSKAQTLIKKADNCRDTLYRSNKRMKYRHNWLNCIGFYQDVYIRRPKSDQAVWALYRLAQMYIKLHKFSNRQNDLDNAIEHFRKLAREYPNHRLADDAQYKVGEIFLNYKNDPTLAYIEFLKVNIKFPSGDMTPRAKVKLDKIAAIIRKKDTSKTAKDSIPRAGNFTGVKNIRHWSTPNYTRIVIDLEKPVKYSSHLLRADTDLKKPRRLYVDLENTRVDSDFETSISIRDGLLKMARAGQYNKNTVRIVLDINSIGEYKIFPLHDPFRIVVDVRGSKKKVKKAKLRTKPQSNIKKRPVRKGIFKPKQPDNKISLARQLGLSVKRIVIDPGHGGKDPGCFYRGKIREKKIVLSLAKVLAKKIKDRLGCEVFLTRNRDVFISLEKRTALANMKKADLFISLHVNAHKLKGIHGLETYFLNMATDKRAVMVAARENATSQKNISDLQTILNDLMLNTKISESSKLAYLVQKNMLSSAKKYSKRVKSLGVKQAPFYVLIGAEMPAILIEAGFITNSAERKRLLSKKYNENLADGIVAGIQSYIKSINQVYKGG